MKHELVKTENYLLVVDDSEIKDVRPYKGKWQLEKGYILNKFPTYLTDLSDCKIVIAHLPLNHFPILEGVPLLPPLEVKDDAETHIEFMKSAGVHDDDIKNWLKGYNKARETYKFTEEDVMEAMLKICDYYADSINTGGVLDGYKSSKEIIQSLLQLKTPTHFEASGVIETYTGDYNPVMLGTYIYEGGEQ